MHGMIRQVWRGTRIRLGGCSRSRGILEPVIIGRVKPHLAWTDKQILGNRGSLVAGFVLSLFPSTYSVEWSFRFFRYSLIFGLCFSVNMSSIVHKKCNANEMQICMSLVVCSLSFNLGLRCCRLALSL